MDRAVVCLASGLASLRGHCAVGEGHAVGGAIGLALVAVLVVDHVVLWLVALDLTIERNTHNALLSLINRAAGVSYQITRAPTNDYLHTPNLFLFSFFNQ